MFTKPEYAKITKQAKRHSLSRTKYTHDAVLAYGEHKTMALDGMAANYIREALMLNYHMLRSLREEAKIATAIEEQAIDSLASIQKMIVESLERPERIERAIAELIELEPAYRSKLIELINTH